MIRRTLFLLAIVGLCGCVHRTAGSSPALWRLRGSIVAVQPDVVTVQHKSGKLIRVALDDQTIFISGGERDSAAALQPGVRVVITVETSVQQIYRARQVELFRRRAQ